MNFLYPGFLLALLAIAIPIVIHLFNFRKYKRIYFSNVQFLKDAQEQDSSRRKLRDRLILLCRLLAVCFLVLAFARPYLSSEDSKGSNTGNLLRIYVDNSYSMETVNKEGSLLDEAKRKAREIAGNYGLNDRFQLLTNDFNGTDQRLLNREQFLEQLEDVRISSSSRRLQQVIDRLQSDLDNGRNQIGYLISDFQRSFLGKQPLKTDERVKYTLIRLQANSLPNVAVDSLWSLSPVHRPGQPERFVVQLKNYGDKDAIGLPLRLNVDKETKSLRTVDIPAGKSVQDTLSFGGLNTGWQRGSVSIRDFPLTFDDELHFSFRISQEMKVLYIHGDTEKRYIQSLFKSDPFFKLTEMPASNIRYSDFPGYSLIILSDMETTSSGLAQELKSYVQNGGNLVLFPEMDSNIMDLNTFLRQSGLPEIAELKLGKAVSSSIDPKDPFFSGVFEQLPKNIDLPQVSRYFTFKNQNRLSKQDILRLPLSSSLLARYGIGDGSVYLSASSLAPEDGNFSEHPVFVPIMFQIAFSSARQQPLFYTVGSSSILEAGKIDLLANQSLTLNADDFEVIPELRQVPGKTLLFVSDQVKKPGFYELKKADSTLAVMAFNEDRTESDMHYASPEQLKERFKNQAASVFNAEKDALSLRIAGKNSSLELWKLCLILALVFLVVEILLIRYFNKTKNISTT